MAGKYNITAPNLPVSPQQYSQPWQEQFSNVQRLYNNSIANAVNSPIPYGAYYDTTSQTAAAINTAYAMKFNTIQAQHAVKRGNVTSRIYASDRGLYNIQFSAQLNTTAGVGLHVYIWLRVNSVDVPYSTSKVIVGHNNETVAAWNFYTSLNDGDYFELMWSTEDTRAYLEAVAATAPVPAVPSLILTVNWVSNLAL
jgi:hypothetical protein